MHDYKGTDCLHGSVAFAHGNLDASAASPRTGAKRAPNSPRSLHRCGIVLFGYAQPVFAVLQEKSEGKTKGQMSEEKIAKRRERYM